MIVSKEAVKALAEALQQAENEPVPSGLCFVYTAGKEMTMSTVTFDTQEFVAKLRAAGFDEKQAEAVVRVVADAQSHLVTREHFDVKLELLETKIDAKFDKLSWMMGILIALAIANFAKQFF
ncbi:MAG: hypothetical protein AW09_004141 [Candidatus Accumulibacter phosphatis]|jgi:hypothetical protein|uniref:DUF1640 domain-containing protein n=2 Tax=Candidatus Accumulibacter TaxID=327159 RepID=A0A080LRB6_9PROT|nr:MAG: hypothetical protein AW09_004141 [Candidatus Accumulibacter phosphatis]